MCLLSVFVVGMGLVGNFGFVVTGMRIYAVQVHVQ